MYLGIDLGTGSLKTFLLASSGAVYRAPSVPYQVVHPQEGWAETNPQEWWSALVTACNALDPAQRAQVQAISFSGQMHGLVLTDAALEPLRPALLWPDTRTAPLLERYSQLAQQVSPPLDNPVTTGMFGPGLLWVSQNEPHLYAQAAHALLPKDWLRSKMGAAPASDPSDVSGTLLATPQGQWNMALVAALGLRPELLPPVLESGAVAGILGEQAAQQLGLRAGIPLVTGAGDTAAALLGSGLQAGQAQLTVGSAAQLVYRLSTPLSAPDLQLYRAAEEGWYALAAFLNAGITLEWVRELLSLSWDEVYTQAFAQDAAPELLFLPYLSGERTPLMSHRASGSFSGLRLAHSKGQVMRAALEGVAFAFRDGLDSMERTHGSVQQLYLAGGGTREGRWQQLLADALGRTLSIKPVSDASSLGAALLACQGVGQRPPMHLADQEAYDQEAHNKGDLPQQVAPGAQQGNLEQRFQTWKALQSALQPWWEVQT